MASSRLCVAAAAMLTGACSGIQFSRLDDGHSHPYRVAMPAIKVVTDPDCKMTAEVISIPGRFNYLKFKSGLGKIDDSVEFEAGGTIKKIAAKQEGVADDLTKVIGAVSGAVRGPGGPGFAGFQKQDCQPSVRIFPIGIDGSVNQASPLLNVEARTTKETDQGREN